MRNTIILFQTKHKGGDFKELMTDRALARTRYGRWLIITVFIKKTLMKKAST